MEQIDRIEVVRSPSLALYDANAFSGVADVTEFKDRTQHSILSCDYRWINRLQEKDNGASLEQANNNKSI